MRHEEQVKQVRKLLDYIESGSTSMAAAVYHNDVSNYTCALRAQKEHEVLFRTQPLLIGLSCEIPASGDYLTDDFSGVPILLVRCLLYTSPSPRD